MIRRGKKGFVNTSGYWWARGDREEKLMFRIGILEFTDDVFRLSGEILPRHTNGEIMFQHTML